jgi:tripartite-type tricarboxylate transporter receptor subunit TctC
MARGIVVAPEAMAKLDRALKEILSSAAIRERFGKQGAEPGTLTGKGFRRFVEAGMVKCSKVVERANVKLD